MTVVPPSVHESGEPIEFDRDGEPAHVDREELLSAASHLAAAALLARQWVEGERHELALALGGVFARSGWRLEEAQAFVQAICEATADEQARSQLRNVSDAYQRVTAGENAYGFPKLADLIGKQRVEKVSKWLNLHAVSDPQQKSPTVVEANHTRFSSWRNISFSDSGMAEWFAAQHRSQARYSHHHRAWFLWNSRFWEKDDSGRATKLALESVKSLATGVTDCQGSEDAKRLLDGVRRSLDAYSFEDC
jgi:hypothetical protein